MDERWENLIIWVLCGGVSLKCRHLEYHGCHGFKLFASVSVPLCPLIVYWYALQNVQWTMTCLYRSLKAPEGMYWYEKRWKESPMHTITIKTRLLLSKWLAWDKGLSFNESLWNKFLIQSPSSSEIESRSFLWVVILAIVSKLSVTLIHWLHLHSIICRLWSFYS